MGRRSLAEKEKRLPRIFKLLGTGLLGHEIAKELGISRRTFCYDLKELRKRMKASKHVDEACLRIIANAEQTLLNARLAYSNASDTKTKLDALRVINQTRESLEKSYARHGLVPIEKRGIDLQGELDQEITVRWLTPKEAKEKKEKDAGST